jgi:hypothetical protein
MPNLHRRTMAVYRRSKPLLRGGAVVRFLVLVPQVALAANTVTRWTEYALQAVRSANVGTPNAAACMRWS